MLPWILGAFVTAGVAACLGVTLVVLHKIELEFHTDHGTSMKDALNRLEDAIERIERSAAGDRLLAQGVATDLDAGHERANAASGDPGAAADAQAKNAPSE